MEAIHYPGGPETFVWMVELLLLPVTLLHAVLALYVMVLLFVQRDVSIGWANWLFWSGCVAVEGTPALLRLHTELRTKKQGRVGNFKY